MVKCIHIRNSNKYAKWCGCTAVTAAIRPAPYKPPGSCPAVLPILAKPAAGSIPLAAEGAPGSREAAPFHIPELLPLHTPRIHAPRARPCWVYSAHCWGAFCSPLKVFQRAARRHPSTSRSYYRSTHPASTRRGRAPAGCTPLTAGDSPGIRKAEPFRI